MICDDASERGDDLYCKRSTYGSARLDFTAEAIPEYAVKIMATAAIELTESILRQPGGREMLDAETARRKAERAINQGK